jgi:hypothetical protein
MSFVLKQSDSYSWPVPLLIPVDGGKKQKFSFDAQFKRLKHSRINQIIKQARAIHFGREEEDMLDDQEGVREILVGWSGVFDDDGNEVPFSESALLQLIEIQTVPGQIIKAWFDSMETSKQKN